MVSTDPHASPNTPSVEGEGSGRRRDAQRLETRERVFQAALDEIRSQGFDAAQVDRIAAAADVARGTFYFHFPTKEEVLVELQRRHEAMIVDRLAEALGAPSSAKALLDRIVDAVVDAEGSLDRTGLLVPVLSVYTRRGLHVDFDQEPMLRALEEFFGRAADRGEVRRDLTPQELTRLFMTSVFGVVVSHTGDAEARRRALHDLVAVFVRGLAP